MGCTPTQSGTQSWRRWPKRPLPKRSESEGIMPDLSNDRRGFLQRVLSAAGLAAAPAAAQAAPPQSSAPAPGAAAILPPYTRVRTYKSLKQSSYDKTGGNRDAWPIPAGGTYEIFN